VAFAGTALTGFGYSPVFPSMGVEAMKRVDPKSRGLVLAAYLACFDLGLGAAGPLAGVVAATAGIPAAFLAAAGAALLSLALTVAAHSGKIGTR
jgi:predicted MFS family arabinose efflux permease